MQVSHVEFIELKHLESWDDPHQNFSLCREVDTQKFEEKKYKNHL